MLAAVTLQVSYQIKTFASNLLVLHLDWSIIANITTVLLQKSSWLVIFEIYNWNTMLNSVKLATKIMDSEIFVSINSSLLN